MFSKEVYSKRRQTLRENLRGESGIVIFIGNVESPAQYLDNGYKWRQDSNWLYFFGIDEPRFAAVMDLDSGQDTIYADDYDVDDIIWTGPMPTVRELAERAGVANSDRYDKLTWVVSDALIKGRMIHFLPASRYYNAIKLSSLLGIEPMEAFRQGKKGCPAASLSLVNAVVKMRIQKTEEEIALLDQACILGQEMHTAARKAIRTGIIEQEVVAKMESVANLKGWGVSFPTILTQHGEIFHCHSHDCIIEPGKLMVVDAGVESNDHYASDFTRTYPTTGKFTPKQRDIYDIVYNCNELAYSMVKPGTTYLDVHMAVEKKMVESLKSLGLLNGNVDDMVTEGVAGLFMPHGLGHNMGMDVHDMEDLGEDLVGYDNGQTRSSLLGRCSLRMARSLKPGNVITDEPGIYFIPALISQWKEQGKAKNFVNYTKLEQYYDFGGIRIEDDVLVTENGARRLGGERLPASSADVESAMQQDKE